MCDGKVKTIPLLSGIKEILELCFSHHRKFKETLIREENIIAVYTVSVSLQSQTLLYLPQSQTVVSRLAVACRSLTVCWMTWHLSPSLIMADDDSDYCYRSCRSDSVKVLWAAHTAGSSAAQPYFCPNMHLTETQGRMREDLCTGEDGPVKYWRPASVALCDPGGRTEMLKKPSNTCAVVLKNWPLL